MNGSGALNFPLGQLVKHIFANFYLQFEGMSFKVVIGFGKYDFPHRMAQVGPRKVVEI